MGEHTKEPWSVFAAGHTTQIDQGVTPHGSRPCVVSWGGFDSTGLSLRKNRANARRIVDCVNALAGMNPAAVASLIEAARELRISLAITRVNILGEINRCDDPSESRWAGVPELLAKRIATFDEALTALRGAQ